MGMKYTKIAADAFEKLTLNAGIICRTFNPETAVVGDIIAATTGGLSFAENPTYTDFGEDVDNVPANTKQLLRITAYDPVISGTQLTLDDATIAELIGGADIGTASAAGVKKISPRAVLEESDFKDLWFIVDYSDVNTGDTAGFVAIHLINSLNRTGFQLKTGKNAKGQSTFEYHGHYDITDDDQTPPFEIYVKAGTSGNADPAVKLDKHVLRIVGLNNTATLNAFTTPAGATVTWDSASTSVATVSGGVVTGETAGNTIITASITDSGVTYNDTCTVIVTAS